VRPGAYSAELVVLKDGESRQLGGRVSFDVERMYEPALAGAPLEEVDAFWKELASVGGQVSAASYALSDAVEDVETLQQVLARAPAAPGELDAQLHDLRQELHELDEQLSGNKSRGSITDTDVHRVTNWLWHANNGVDDSSYGPTPAHRRSLQYAREAFAPIRERLTAIIEADIPALRQQLLEAGAPWGRGQTIPGL
jgi:hypothetical protein